jgi:putative NADPH-quinone reductase
VIVIASNLFLAHKVGLRSFTEGIQSAGAEVEKIYTNKLRINPCLGCYRCQFKTPGKCIQRDDMLELLPKLKEADFWILASPLYFGGVSSPLKVFIDRLAPLIIMEPVIMNGKTVMKSRWDLSHCKVCLVATGGLWELDNFIPMVDSIKEMCRHFHINFISALLRPHAGRMVNMLKAGGNLSDLFIAAENCGKSLVKTGTIPQDLTDIIARELLTRQEFLDGMYL